MAVIRVLIADDDPGILWALSRILKRARDIEVVAVAENGEVALEAVGREKVDVILSDIQMPKMDGIELLQALKTIEDPPKFVAMTGLDNDESMLKMLSLGAVGYIIKSSRPDDIVNAVRDAHSGGTSVSPNCLTRLVRYIAPGDSGQKATAIKSSAKPSIPLIQSEKNVLNLLCEGKSNAEIAEATEYAESTVKKIISRLLSLYDVSSRLELVVKVLSTR